MYLRISEANTKTQHSNKHTYKHKEAKAETKGEKSKQAFN